MESRETIDLDFHRLWSVIKRRWLIAVVIFSVGAQFGLVLALLQKPSYESQGKLLIKKINQTSALTGLGEQIGELEGLDIKSSPISTEMEVVRSTPLLEKTISALNLKDDKGVPLPTDTFAEQIKLKAIPATDVLQISYESKDPNKAASVVNKLMSLYIENNVLTNRAAAVAAGDFIAKQLPQTEANVRQAELALRHFKERNQVVQLDEESKSAVAILKELESKITEVRAELSHAIARSVSLQSKIGMSSQEAITTDTLNDSTTVQKLLENLQQIKSELALQQTRFQETHPTIKDLKDKRDALNILLQKQVAEITKSKKQIPIGNLQIGEVKQKVTEEFVYAEAHRIAVAQRLAALTQAETAYKQRINILPKLEQEQRELERQLDAAQSTYETLLKKLQEVRVTENQNLGNARIIEPALVTKKSATSKKVILLILGCAIGTLFGTATIVLLELRDTSIKTLKEAKNLFGYTLLGAIPSVKKKVTRNQRRKDTEWTIPELPVRDTPRLPIAESYRMLQANLKFLSSDKPLQVIVVTSSVPKEGKSTVSANLAAAMAQLGRRVLLVDADMRHPLQHHIWDLTNVAGLSDVIVGQAEFNAAVTEGMPNLDVLTAGVIPPNPLALLDSKRMAALIEHFSTTYDFIIIDAPPLVLGADALTLGKMTDGILLVARPGVLSYTGTAAAKEALERSGQKVLGLVVNGVILENESDSYFYYAKEYSNQEYSHQKVKSS